VYQFSSETIDVDAIRSRLRTLSDAQLEKHGRAAAYMVSPAASYGKPRETWTVQLTETRAEWRRRHPSPTI